MRKKTFRYVCAVCFGGYVLFMLWLLFGQRWGAPVPFSYGESLLQNCNLLSFSTVLTFCRILRQASSPAAFRHAVVNLAGNIVMFVPLGFFLPCLWRKMRCFRRFLLCHTGVIAAIELAQWLTFLGSMDVDDLILNTCGGAAGFGLFCLCRAAYSRIARTV